MPILPVNWCLVGKNGYFFYVDYILKSDGTYSLNLYHHRGLKFHVSGIILVNCFKKDFKKIFEEKFSTLQSR